MQPVITAADAFKSSGPGPKVPGISRFAWSCESAQVSYETGRYDVVVYFLDLLSSLLR